MKNIIITLLISGWVTTSSSQTYRNYVEITEASFDGQGYSYSSNGNLALNNHESQFLQVYLDIFRATYDKKYLDKFIIHTKRVQERRDDNIQFITNQVDNPINCSENITQVPTNLQSKAWGTNSDISSCDELWPTRVLHSASLTYPMSQFVYFLKTDPDFMVLAGEQVPSEAQGSYLGSSNIQTYSDFADWLEGRINETIQWHECYWKKFNIGGQLTSACDPLAVASGLYYYDCDITAEKDATNMNTAMGRTLIMMYLVSVENDNPNQTYLCQITDIATILHGEVLFLNVNDPNAYTWNNDWEHVYIEDIAHAAITMEFADLCVEYGMRNSYNNTLLFQYGDMVRFSNTFANHIYRAPLDYAKNTFGTDVDITFPIANAEPIGGYVFLSKYNPYIYQQISDYFFDRPIDNSGIEKSFANLALFQHLFNPLAILRGDRFNTSVQYNSVAAGDFDGSGHGNIAVYNGVPASLGITVFSLDAAHHLVPTATYQNSYFGITGGNFDNTHQGDEIAAIDHTSNNNVVLLAQSGNVISPFASLPTDGVMTSIAAGDIDGDGLDEIVTINSSSIYIYKYSVSGLTQVTTQSISGFNRIAVANFDPSNPGDEIIGLDPYGGGMFMFEGLSLTATYSYSGTGGSDFYNGVTGGDFDGDGIAEIICHRSNDGAYVILKLRNGVISNNPGDIEYFPVDQQNNLICTSYFSAFPLSDALITIRAYDDQISVFNLQGKCPGLTLSNQTITGATSTDNDESGVINNFNLDYHVNNTLIVGNNFNIDAPSTVTFTAGNEIILHDGFIASAGSNFRAYIDQTIGCSDPVFRLAGEQTIATQHFSDAHRVPLGTGNLKVSPNPTPGNFSYSIDGAKGDNQNYQMRIIDILGNVVYESNRAAATGQIDLSSYSNGNYFLKICSQTGDCWTERLVVSH